MNTIRVKPSGLVKKLVGETITISVELQKDIKYRVELFTNVNHVSESYAFDFENEVYSCTLKLKESGFFKWNIRYKREGTKTWKYVKDESNKRLQGIMQVDPLWLDQAVVYNIFVRFFKGTVNESGKFAKPGDGGTFDDVKAHLGTLKDMGVNVLYLNPIHLIGELHRKYNMLDTMPSYWQPGSPYSIKDYKSIDPELTFDRDTKKHLLSDPQQEFRDLVHAAHEKGMYVVMDLVFNHTAHDFVFQRIRPEWYLYKEHITSLTDPFLYPEDMKHGKPWGDATHTMSPYDHGVWFEDVAQLNWEYDVPVGPNKPPKNPGLKEMWEYFKSIPKYWIRNFGIDGFRCDIAYKVPPSFWKACIAESREEARVSEQNLSKDVVFVAEAMTDSLTELQEAGFTAVYGDYSNKLKYPQDFLGYLDYMYNRDKQHFPEGSKWFVFPEVHDFDRTPRKILGDNLEDSKSALLANKSRWLLTATVPGIPLIFNGFEKVEWKPINLFGYGAVNWSRENDLSDYLSQVNEIRRRIPALSLTGEFLPLETNQGLNESTQLVAYLRHKGDSTVLIVVNMDVYNQAGPAIVKLPIEFDRTYRLTDELNKQVFVRTGRELVIVLEPGGGHLFSVKWL